MLMSREWFWMSGNFLLEMGGGSNNQEYVRKRVCVSSLRVRTGGGGQILANLERTY